MSLLQARESLATGAVLKVLIVDDDVKLVEGLATFLERAGYEWSASGTSATRSW